MTSFVSQFGAPIDGVYANLAGAERLTVDHPRPVLSVAEACALVNTLASTNSTLQSLTLDRVFATNGDESPVDLAESLARLLLLRTSLTSLAFVNHGFYVGGRFGEVLFDALATRPQQLIELDLHGNYVGDGGLAGAGMAFLRANTSLRKLDLSCCLIEKLNGPLLTALAFHPTLEWLHLREARLLGDADRDAMTMFLAHTARVREFDASTGGFGARDMADVFRALAARAQLQHFRINCLEPLDGPATDALVELVQRNTLQSLVLFCQTFCCSTDHRRFADAVLANTTLTEINLGRLAHDNPLAAVMRRNVARRVVGVALVLLHPLVPYVVADILALVEPRQTHADIVRIVCGVQASRQAVFTLRRARAGGEESR